DSNLLRGHRHIAAFKLNDQFRQDGDDDAQREHVEEHSYEDEGEGGAKASLLSIPDECPRPRQGGGYRFARLRLMKSISVRAMASFPSATPSLAPSERRR